MAKDDVIEIDGKVVEALQHVGKVALSYNKTKGFWLDGIETYLQKFGLQSLVDLLKDTAHKADLKTQIDTYKASIKSGHKVLVVAHSQGNLFTNEVYKKLLGHTTDWWMTRYFKVVSIASPMCFKITPNTPGISWDNDVVPNMVGLCSAFNVENNVRKVSWEFYDGTPRVARPNHNYIYRNQVGVVYKNSWKGIEEGNDENVHAFTFYMGKALKKGDKNKPNYDEIYLNPFDDKNITNDTAKDLIMTTIKSQIDELEKLSSQWIIDQEFDKNTCDYKITLKHQYDPSIEIGEKVYPFNASKKLYQVNGEWVKASCGGKNILETWDGKKDNECWMIDNVEKEKITLAGNKYSISLTARASAGENMCAELGGGVWIGSKTVHSHSNMQTGSCSYNIEELCDKSVAYTSETFGQMLNILNQDVESLKNKLANIDPMITLGEFEVKPISSYESYSACYRGNSSGTGKEIVYQIDIQIMSAYMNVETLYSKLGSIASDYGLYFWRKI